MMSKELIEPKPGEIWRDLDKRMLSGHRRVRIDVVEFDRVTYRQVVGANDRGETRQFRSKLARFQRAFERIAESLESPAK